MSLRAETPTHQCASSIGMDAGHTVAGARTALTRAFRQAALDTPELDARVLVQFALRLDTAQLATDPHRRISSDQAEKVCAAARRRLRREPVAHIVGAREFWSLPLRVTAETLIPRPETETVVEAALATLNRRGLRICPLRVADLGTGSGALLLALLSELPHARGIGTDRSPPALAVARDNAEQLGFAARAAFLACDFAAALDQRFDLIVSNPPYIASAEIETLAPDVRDYEPRLALDGGSDGLAAYRALARQIARVLTPDGILVVEIGYGQAEHVTAVFTEAGFDLVEPPRFDLAGIPRSLVLQRH